MGSFGHGHGRTDGWTDKRILGLGLIFLGFIFGTRVNKNRATISPIGLGLINMYMYMFILYMYICLYLGMHQAFSLVNL